MHSCNLITCGILALLCIGVLSFAPAPCGLCVNRFCFCSHGVEGGVLLNCSAPSPISLLDLRSNFLSSILPTAFHDASLSTLEILYLEDNLLTEIDPVSFSNLTILSSLFLSYNQLQELDPTDFLPMQFVLQYIYFNNNPWDCSNCNVHTMAELTGYYNTKSENAAYCVNSSIEISTYSGPCTLAAI